MSSSDNVRYSKDAFEDFQLEMDSLKKELREIADTFEDSVQKKLLEHGIKGDTSARLSSAFIIQIRGFIDEYFNSMDGMAKLNKDVKESNDDNNAKVKTIVGTISKH